MLGLLVESMSNLRKTVAALGFVCFFSLALLPVSMAVCGPFMSRLFHQAKRHHHAVRERFPEMSAAPARAAFAQRDIISEADPVRSLFEHTGIGRSSALAEAALPEIHLNQRFLRSAKISSFVFHSVLLL